LRGRGTRNDPEQKTKVYVVSQGDSDSHRKVEFNERIEYRSAFLGVRCIGNVREALNYQ
jgi:hypothetical protein